MPTTRWIITFGTYAARLHGGPRPTVERPHNKLGDDYVVNQPRRAQYERGTLNDEPVLLTREQQRFIEATIPALCTRGGWTLVECSAAPDHVHAVLDIDESLHGKRVRAWLKRWLSEALDARWQGAVRRNDGMHWWAEGGSARAVRGHEYRGVIINYVARQRATPDRDPPHP